MYENDMLLDALVSVIESLKETIRRDHATIGTNETRTRNALIDPLLKGLGWSDSTVVTPEYLIRYGEGPGDYGVVDYALHTPDNRAQPLILIEAKRMSEPLNDTHREQALSYALSIGEGIRYFGLTNGDLWEFCEIAGEEVHVILEMSIRRQSAEECARLLRYSFPIWSARDRHLTYPNARQFVARPSVKATTKTRVLKVSTWFVVACFLSAVLGYALGFQAAEPVSGGFVPVGIVTIFVTILLVGIIARSRSRPVVRGFISILRTGDSYGLARPKKAETLKWLFAAMLGGVVSGGALGYFAGERTAQSLLNLVDGLGVLVIIALIGLIVAALLPALATAEGRDGHGRRWGRRRRRQRRLRTSHRRRS